MGDIGPIRRVIEVLPEAEPAPTPENVPSEQPATEPLETEPLETEKDPVG
jgi:hypothetical protein